MCGIAGYLTTGARGDSAARVKAMTDAILHRGPDSDGHWEDDEAGIALGMRRLAIIDLSEAGRQPMTSADGRYVLVFNGEIYNFHDIRAELEAAGKAPQWRGHSDTEVLLAAISAWGIKTALQKCNGMFGIALWDRRERTLQLAIDRFGEKPIFAGWMGDTFVFGSEIKALMGHPAWSGVIDRRAMGLYLRFSYVPAPWCIYQGLRKLEPGTLATLKLDAVQAGNRDPHIEAYWSAREAVMAAKARPLALDDTAAADEFEKILARAVKLRMEADVPLGAFLSGGFDSTAIVAMMQSQSPRPVKTFTIGFTERAYNEAPFAKSVAEHLKTDHTELYVSPQQAMDVIPRLPAMYDEPFADSSQIPTYLVAQMARRHVTVALSGDAGDELFGGYARYFISNRALPAITRLPLGLRRLAAGAIYGVGADGWDALYRLGTLGRGKGLVGDRALKFASLLALPSLMEGYRAIVSSWNKPQNVVPDAGEPMTALNDPAALPPGLSFIEQMMFLDTVSYLPGDILTKVDRATMAVSLEGRVPFLDPNVLDFAWRLPMEQKVRGSTGKWLLRQLVYRHVPRAIMDRPKMGFGIPLNDWLRGPLRDWAEDLLAPAMVADAGLEAAPVRKLWQEQLSGNRNWQHMLWPVLMLTAWKKAYGGRTPSAVKE
jgi:asparagine synthase (glutamine-hydrolysing)